MECISAETYLRIWRIAYAHPCQSSQPLRGRADIRIRLFDAHRLVPSKYGESGQIVLDCIADEDDQLVDTFDLGTLTNDGVAAEKDEPSGIGVDELLFVVLQLRIINAASYHAHPLASRCNIPDHGAWYAGLTLETPQAEIAGHKASHSNRNSQAA